MRVPALLVIAAAGALMSGCAHQAQAAGDESVPVSVTAARTGTFATPVQLSGTLSAVHSTTLGAAASGRVVAVNVRAGDRVDAGELIAQIDTSQYGAQLAGARAGASAAADSQRAAQAQLEQAQSRLDLARVTAQRMSQLYAEGAISKQQQDETQSNLAAAQAGVAQAQAGLSAAAGMTAQAQAGVDAAAVPLQNTAITAPFSGIVTQKLVEPGAVVGPGSPIAEIQDTSDLELDVALPEDDAAALVPGTQVAVHVDALGTRSIPGSVRAIVPSRNPALRSATLKIAVEPRRVLLPGMFARVTIAGAPHSGVSVPLSALVTRAGQAGVFAVQANTASFVPVQTGTSTQRAVEVQGLASGSTVAVSNVSRLTDGVRVTVLH